MLRIKCSDGDVGTMQPCRIISPVGLGALQDVSLGPQGSGGTELTGSHSGAIVPMWLKPSCESGAQRRILCLTASSIDDIVNNTINMKVDDRLLTDRRLKEHNILCVGHEAILREKVMV